MKLTVLHHNNCFDGLASAAVFTRFFLKEIEPGAETGYVGLAHEPNQKLIPDELFDGDVNAIVDFKYSPSERLTWWFDHHQSAFLSPEDEKHFHAEVSATKIYDPSYRSCTKLIADTAAARYGFAQPELADLIYWADLIDGAKYKDARTAVELKAPALRLMLVIEATKEQRILEKIIRDMQVRPLEEIIADPEIEGRFRPLFERHLKTNDLIARLATCENKVVYFDLSGHNVEGYSKFIPYYLYPDCIYSVSVIQTEERTKVSVGFNPWSPYPRQHNLASICERYNGGGHAVVGAISYRTDEIEQARRTAQAIASELRR